MRALVLGLALLAATASVVVLSPPASGSTVTSVSVSTSSTTAGDTAATWTVTFTTSAAGALDGTLPSADYVTVAFPSGFTLAVPPLGAVLSTGFAGTCSSPASSVTGQDVQVDLPSGCSLAASTQGTITFTGVNPAAGTYHAAAFSVSTSRDTTATAATGSDIVIGGGGGGGGGGGSQVSAVSFTPATATAGATGSWTVGFTSSSSGSLAGGAGFGYVLVTFPAGFTIPSPSLTGSFGSGFSCNGHGALGQNVGAQTIEVDLPTGCTLAASTAAVVTLDGITNPATASSYTGAQVATSADAVPVAAAAIGITAAPSTYTVGFDANGGTGSMAAETFTSGVANALTTNAFTRSGYTFVRWTTAADGSGTSYSDGQSITVAANITLYAQWTPITYTVGFDANGGSGSMAAETFTSGVAKALTTNAFTRSGYAFAGWNTAANGSGTSYSGGQSTTFAADTTLFATWTALPAAPTGVSAAAGVDQATVSWTAPASTGGAPITRYTVTSDPDGKTCSWSTGQLRCTVTGLTAGRSYTFTVVATSSAGTGSSSTASAAVTPSAPWAVTGFAGVVEIFDTQTGTVLDSFRPFAGYTGDLSVATGDVNGDGISDIVVARGANAPPLVEVYDGKTLSPITSFLAFDAGFTGGVSVAAGDVNGDGKAEIVVGAGPGGGPVVGVFNGSTGVELEQFFAFAPSFTGGVSVAAGDVNGDGKADVVVGAGPGGSPAVRVLDGSTNALLANFLAFAPTFTGGVSVAAADVNGDGKADLVVGPGSAGQSQVSVYDGGTDGLLQSLSLTFPSSASGVTVAGGDVNGDGAPDVVAATDSASGTSPAVAAFDGQHSSALSLVLPADVSTAGATRSIGSVVAIGASSLLAPSASLRLPGAPTGVTATAGPERATVSWTAPADAGTAPITGYTVSAVGDATKTCTTTGDLSCAVGGLTAGASYTFTVTAANSVGSGAASQPSPSVEPAAGCSAGTFLWKGACVDAGKGYFVASAGATAANPCPAGTYQPDEGQTSCIPAPAGSHVSKPQATAADACPVDTYTSAVGSIDCSTCPPGTTTAGQTGQTVCVTALAVTGVSPARGKAAVPTTITLTGTGLTSGATVSWSQGATAGGTCGDVSASADRTSLTCTLPGGAPAGSPVSFTVTEGVQTASAPADQTFTPVRGPVITGVSPPRNYAGSVQTVTLSGTDLGLNAGSITGVTYGPQGTGSTCMAPTWVSVAQLTCLVGTDVAVGSSVSFIASILGIASAPSTATYTAVTPPPVISSVDPAAPDSAASLDAGAAQHTVVIHLMGKVSSGATASYTSGGPSVACTTTAVSAGGLSVTCTTGKLAAGSVAFTVADGDQGSGSAPSQPLWVVAGPVITSVSPSTAQKGTGDVTVTIDGTGLQPGGAGKAQVQFFDGTSPHGSPTSCDDSGATAISCTLSLKGVPAGDTVYATVSSGGVTSARSASGVTAGAAQCAAGWAGEDCQTAVLSSLVSQQTVVTHNSSTLTTKLTSLTTSAHTFSTNTQLQESTLSNLVDAGFAQPANGLSLSSASTPTTRNGVLIARAVSWKPARTARKPLVLTFHAKEIRAGDVIFTHTRAGFQAVGAAARNGSATVAFTHPGAFVLARVRRAPGYTLVGSRGTLVALGGRPGATPRVSGAVVAASADRAGLGGALTDARGRVATWGDVARRGSLHARLAKGDRVVSIATLPLANGYFLATRTGRVFGFGTAHVVGSLAKLRLPSPIVSILVSEDGRGYQLVSAAGTVYSFGDAPTFAPLGLRLKRPVVAATAVDGGLGVLLVDAAGHVTTVGAAGFYGDLSRIELHTRVVGIVASPSGKGYTLVDARGDGIAFGDAKAYQPAAPPKSPVAAVA